jgi:DNA polymerase-4
VGRLLKIELQPLIDKVWRHCASTGARGRTVTLKVKFADFEFIARSRSAGVIETSEGLSSLAFDLSADAAKEGDTLIGISISGFADQEPEDQLALMFDGHDVQG